MGTLHLAWFFVCRVWPAAYGVQGESKTNSGFTQTQPRIKLSCKTFTPANTHLDKASQYPELGSMFKAAFVKACSWFFTRKAIEISQKNPTEPFLFQSVFMVG